MKIAIDCRYLGKSGIGRVTEGILENLDFSADEFYLIGKRESLAKYEGAHIVEDDSDPYSVRGLFCFPKELNKIVDAVFIPNFLVPFGIRRPVYAIMHDLAFLDVKETTKGFKDALIKKVLLKRCMKRAKTVFCVSAFTKGRCEHYYGKLAKKCIVNYNGLSESVISYARTHAPAEKRDEIVFVGNVKPHKGLKTLLAAFSGLKGETKLRIIGEKEHFLTGLHLDESAYKNVEFTGRLSDEELLPAIARAKYLVLPSVYEGFGLPPLEALVLGTQPIVSDIPVFKEVYEGLPVVYFEGAEGLREALSRPAQAIGCREEVLSRYSYARCAKTIVEHIRHDRRK